MKYVNTHIIYEDIIESMTGKSLIDILYALRDEMRNKARYDDECFYHWTVNERAFALIRDKFFESGYSTYVIDVKEQKLLGYDLIVVSNEPRFRNSANTAYIALKYNDESKVNYELYYPARHSGIGWLGEKLSGLTTKSIYFDEFVLRPDANSIPDIEKVIYNNPATIVIWKDGSKTVVKCANEDFDPEKGLAMAIVKKVSGNEGNYYNLFRKWAVEDE